MSVDLNRLDIWVAPATIQLSDEELHAYGVAIAELAVEPVGKDLVLAAHGSISEWARAKIAETVATHLTTFVARRKDELLSRLAGAVVIHRLETEPQDSVLTAELVQSAAFIQLAPSVPEVSRIAHALLENHGIAQRTRRKLSRTARKRITEESTAVETANALNYLLQRGFDLLTEMENRLDLQDEEINTLWWARSKVSYTTGESWVEIDPHKRVVVAALEMGDLLGAHPPTRAQRSLLRDISGSSEERVPLGELGPTLAQKLAADARPGLLMPLTTVATLWREHDDNQNVARALLMKEGYDPDLNVPLSEVAEQILREQWMGMTP